MYLETVQPKLAGEGKPHHELGVRGHITALDGQADDDGGDGTNYDFRNVANLAADEADTVAQRIVQELGAGPVRIECLGFKREHAGAGQENLKSEPNDGEAIDSEG